MKKNRIFSFILSLVLSVSICGCTKKANENRDESKATLVNKNGQYYIQFDEIDKNIKDSSANSKIAEYIYFSSMDEFYSKVNDLNFSEEEFDIMCRSFPSDDNGIKVCDMDNLYQPVLPYNTVVDDIVWGGNSYVTTWNAPEVACGIVEILNTEDDFYKVMNSVRPDNFFEKEHVEVLDYSESQNDKYIMKSWIYTTNSETGKSKFRQEQYETVSTDAYYKVIIRYSIESDVDFGYEVSYSDTIPHRTHIFCNSGDKYWYSEFYNIESALDIDWLMSFDIEPYVAE